MSEDFTSAIVSRWGVSARTVKNWDDRAKESGVPCPALSKDPGELLEWYRSQVGREPSKKLKDRAREIAQEAGEPSAEVTTTEIERAPVEVIAQALDRLGLSRSLARVIEEEEIAAKIYEEARRDGRPLDAPRRRWKEALEVKRQLQKGDDAVSVAAELIKDWLREEWEPKERERRASLSGQEIGKEARQELLATKGEQEWCRVWDRWIESGLRG